MDALFLSAELGFVSTQRNQLAAVFFLSIFLLLLHIKFDYLLNYQFSPKLSVFPS
jgi:hypothetical protein